MKLGRLNHIGVATPSLEASLAYYRDVMGATLAHEPFDLPAQDMARGQYWIHPALPEVLENALLALCGEPPWPPPRRH